MDDINICIKIRILGIALALCVATSAELKAQPSPVKVLSGEQAVKESAGKPWAEILAGAQKGDAALQYVAAWKLFHGEGVAFDPAGAVVWFRHAAERGVPEAQFKMGVLAEHGIGRRVDDAQAREWYSKALANGFIPAAHSLSRYESPEKWRSLQMQAARAGYPLSRLTLIGVVEHAQLTAEQKAEAIAWGRELAGQGDHEAQIKLGFNLMQRGIDPVSLMEALKWIELAKAAGVPGAEMLASGAGRSLSAQQLAEVHKGVREMAATPKVTGKMWSHAARLLSHFNPVPESMSRDVIPEIVASLRAAAGKGDRSAALKLAVALQHPSYVKDWQEMQRQQGPGMFVSPFEMGMAGAVNTALSEPARNYKLAAESGDGFACYALACQFADGRGAPRSVPEAVRWFDRGAKLGVTDCDFELGRLYLAGSGIDRSYSKALQHLRKASAASHEPAKTMLARTYGGAGAQPSAISTGSSKPETAALPRVAILPLTAGLESEVSLLTVELSNSGDVILLEREELSRVRSEQMLAAGNRSKVLELAAMLRADGLILLEKTMEQGADQLSARMVAVSQGVVIGTIGQRVAPSNTQAWSALVGQRFLPLLPKLKTPRASSVALSVLAFRSTFNSAGSVENERNLTKLLSQRLISQPEVFVLERARLGAVAQEYRLEGWENRDFWTGSVLVDGQLQPTGSSDELKLSLRLLLPSGDLAGSVEITGDKGRLADMADRAGKEILTQLKRGGPSAPWDTLSESVRYMDEARWMMRWGQSDNAVAAIEVSEALGLTLQELTEIRIQIIRAGGQADARIPSRQWEIAGSIGETNKRSLDTMREALELYSARISNPPRGWEPDQAWHKLGLDLLTSAVNLLHGFYKTPVARLGRPQDLAALRVSCRKLLDQLAGVASLKDGLDG
ncbi:MAG TPA: tetratricopeptide repeat protein, partial [Roseimicrobium sp.]|nr:tetratricopeptide repeat protein [Roseimicrobium sp.]